MKTMKSFLVMLLIAMMPMFITSCQNDKEKEPSNDSTSDSTEDLIIGEWECTEQAYEVSFDGETDGDSESYGSEEYVWEFDDDENLTIYWDGEREGKYDYNVSGKKLYTELIDDWFDGDADYFTIKKLTDTKLILEIEFEDYDEEIIYTFYFDRI